MLLVNFHFHIPELYILYGLWCLLGRPMESFPRAEWRCVNSGRCLGHSKVPKSSLKNARATFLVFVANLSIKPRGTHIAILNI